MLNRLLTTCSLALLASTVAFAQTRQAQADEYYRFELPDAGQGGVKVRLDVAVTSAGSTFFLHPLPQGPRPRNVTAVALATGRGLASAFVTGAEARRAGLTDAALESTWLSIALPAPVPRDGETRIRIEYVEAAPTAVPGGTAGPGPLEFRRPPGIARGSVVLPGGYALESCNVPAQVHTLPDGRIVASFIQPGPVKAPLHVVGRPGLAPFTPVLPTSRGPASTTSLASQASRLGERAFQDREIVYFMNDPATHSFSLYHDYTESRPGIGHYFNVVRAGSRVSNPSARNLDTGEALKVETLGAGEIKRRGLNVGGTLEADAEVVVISFPPVEAGRSTRLRITETYTDPGRYYTEGDEIVWDRAFGRPRNDVVLPAGYSVVGSSIPAVISRDSDGRQRLAFENNRPDEIQVLIRGRKVR